MPTKIGVVLCGNGVFDGSEIHEAVLTMLALDRAGAEVTLMAPDKPQMHVIDHRTGAEMDETRNVLVESARIARGEIFDVASVKADQFDAVILPGGFGAAKNLCTFATEGAACTVDEDVEKLLQDIHASGKPIAALCIAPAVLARVFGSDFHPEITIGNDTATASVLESMGAKHVAATVADIVIDEANRMITTPCYMLAGRISEVATGAEKAVAALLKMVSETPTATVYRRD
jgi:enhancing lycopene biosynthesis protein 2